MKLFVDKKEIKLEFANTFLKRLKGFMGKKNIKTALRFKTKSIHTFFMKEPIDLLLTTKDNKILSTWDFPLAIFPVIAILIIN